MTPTLATLIAIAVITAFTVFTALTATDRYAGLYTPAKRKGL